VLTKLKSNGFMSIYDFVDHPDLVQTFAFLNASMALPLQVNNAENLVHKESNRIDAISIEIKKIGAHLYHNSNNDFYIENKQPALVANAIFKTYQDHRMAMAASILAMKFKSINIENEQVVSKSYPDFWKHLLSAGFLVKQLQ
jgi:3-phosphoshikimate 1-carboxyvinyltransferase